MSRAANKGVFGQPSSSSTSKPIDLCKSNQKVMKTALFGQACAQAPLPKWYVCGLGGIDRFDYARSM